MARGFSAGKLECPCLFWNVGAFFAAFYTAKNRAIRSNFCSAKIPLLSLARLKMASMPFLAVGFCEAKTYETYTAGLHAGGSLTFQKWLPCRQDQCAEHKGRAIWGVNGRPPKAG
jgi:hypothetical protein